MPDHPSTLELVSLQQAVLWIALGLEPLEERFEALEGYPRTVDREDPQHPLSDAQKGKIKAAKKLLGRQLIEGGLAAYGRLMTYELTDIAQEMLASGMPFEQLDPDALDRPRVVIPAKFWRFDTIGWDEGWTGSLEAAGSEAIPTYACYIEVRIRADELWRVFPKPLSKPRQQGTGGRKPVHDQLEIMMLAAWDAAGNDLPAKQSAWVAQIGPLLDLHYEDRAGQEAPQRALLQELGSRLYGPVTAKVCKMAIRSDVAVRPAKLMRDQLVIF